MARLTVNGKSQDIDVDPDTPLLWAIRENVGLTGTKYGCGIAQCGACTVHVDGEAVRSCSMPVSAAEGKAITTIEGLAQNGALHKVQKAWIDHDVPQCGYCQCGMIMAVAALLKEKPKPTDDDINNAITNICRCGTFQQVREAIHAAASTRWGGSNEPYPENQSSFVRRRRRSNRRWPCYRPEPAVRWSPSGARAGRLAGTHRLGRHPAR
jgi:isoquinoline 1-oxidoreductase subunit alpha